MSGISIVIVDNNVEFRESTKNLLNAYDDFNVVGVGCDSYDAIKLMEKHKPDVAIIDMDMLITDSVWPSIIRRSPETSSIVITKAASSDKILTVISNGLSGYIMRATVMEEIVPAIRCVNEGHYYMSREVTSKTIKLFYDYIHGTIAFSHEKSRVEDKSITEPLKINKIEFEIVSAIAEGLSNSEIANLLELKEGTVRNYISLILHKLDLKHRTQIAIYALRTVGIQSNPLKNTLLKCKDGINMAGMRKHLKNTA